MDSGFPRAQDLGVLGPSSFGYGKDDGMMSASNWDGKGGVVGDWKKMGAERKKNTLENVQEFFKCYNNCGEDYPMALWSTNIFQIG